MAKAIIKGLIKDPHIKRSTLIASAASEETLKYIEQILKITAASSNREVVKKSDLIFLAVKPQILEKVIKEIREEDLDGKTFVAMSPGKSISWFEEQFKKPVALIRTAPNTPLMFSEGMTSICKNALTSQMKFDQVKEIFDQMGQTEVVDEKLLDTAMALSGSSPAFVFMFIEALADGAVAEGMPRSMAYKMAAQTVIGSGKMVLESGKLPSGLKDEVASPAGTTIEGIQVLESAGFRAAVMKALRECVAKSKKL